MTVKELAESINVSRATVYRVISNHPYVKDDVRKKVLEAIEKYDCVPNKMGKALALRKKDLKITVIVKDRTDSFYADICTGIYNAFSVIMDSGIEIEIKETFSTSPQLEQKILEDVKNSNTSAVVICFPQSDDIVRTVNELVESGKQVITYSTDLVGSKRLFFVGQDDFKSGRIVGQLLDKMLSPNAEIAICSGLLQNECHKKRVQGIASYITEKCKEMKIIEMPDNNNSDELAYHQTQEMLKHHPDISSLIVISRGINGIIKALREVNLQKKVKVVAFDMIPENKMYQREDIVDVIINQEPIKQGEWIIEILYDYLANDVIPENKVNHTQTQIVLKEMID
ncbi:MAG: LacI family DNA-binding transcriptional regulator [Oscillospiraceae bacterium]